MEKKTEEQSAKHTLSTVVVLDEYGLHARPAANLSKTAQLFNSEIYLKLGDKKVDCKSILDILSLAVAYHTQLTLECIGEDAKEAESALVELFKNKFQLKKNDYQ